MQSNERSVVYIYHGPGCEVPWHKIKYALGAHLAPDATLALTITCDTVIAALPRQRSDDATPSGDEPRQIVAERAQGVAHDARPTMADVAREARVSESTVSRVMRDLRSVRPKTRNRVEEVVRRLGFELNKSASIVAQNKRKRRRKTRGDGEISASAVFAAGGGTQIVS